MSTLYSFFTKEKDMKDNEISMEKQICMGNLKRLSHCIDLIGEFRRV